MKNPAAIETLQRIGIKAQEEACDDEYADEEDKRQSRMMIGQFRRARSGETLVNLLAKSCWDMPSVLEALIHAIDDRAPRKDLPEFDT